MNANVISNRYEFVYLIDVTNGNPNGDPDAGNLPRMDPMTGNGLISDVCLKRKIRNFVQLYREGEPGYGLYVQESSILNEQHRLAYKSVRPGDQHVETSAKLSPKNDAEETAVRSFMCDNFFDVRTFGAVMGTGINCGQVRGPVQLAFGKSIDPIQQLEISITRMAATTEKEAKERKDAKEGEDERSENRTMGRKQIVPYGLYRVHGYISAPLAKRTGFSQDDLDLLWLSLQNMLDHDRSAARGEMTARKLIVFKHQSALGNARASELFETVEISRNPDVEEGFSRKYADYTVSIDCASIPDGVELIEIL